MLFFLKLNCFFNICTEFVPIFTQLVDEITKRLRKSGRHNLRSFLAENSTQNYFLIARMFSFCDIRDKNAVFNILRQNVTNFDIGNG